MSRCSIVRYEIHLFESKMYSSIIASVGHSSMHAVQVPHKSSLKKSSGSNSLSIIISDKNPVCFFNRIEKKPKSGFT